MRYFLVPRGVRVGVRVVIIKPEERETRLKKKASPFRVFHVQFQEQVWI